MFLLLTRDEHVILVFAFFLSAIAERRYTVAVFFVSKPFTLISKTSRSVEMREKERKEKEK